MMEEIDPRAHDQGAGTAQCLAAKVPAVDQADEDAEGDPQAEDGDVDLDDYDLFEECATGPEVPYDPMALPPACTLSIQLVLPR